LVGSRTGGFGQDPDPRLIKLTHCKFFYAEKYEEYMYSLLNFGHKSAGSATLTIWHINAMYHCKCTVLGGVLCIVGLMPIRVVSYVLTETTVQHDMDHKKK
jgi:hypothetical protein